jgi:hypothetical protein
MKKYIHTTHALFISFYLFILENIQIYITNKDSKKTKAINQLHVFTYKIPERVAEASQILLRDAHVLPKLLGNKENYRRDRW